MMHIAITGASGLVGKALIARWVVDGHEVTRLVRRNALKNEIHWDPQRRLDHTLLQGVDAVVHLAGNNIATSRWSASVKREIRRSRIDSTRLLSESISYMTPPPGVMICASAVGIYGDRGGEVLTEESSAGSGFLADVAQDWEDSTHIAAENAIRVVNTRFGMVLSPVGGALPSMVRIFRWGLGGKIGSGDQYWSWISIDDTVGAVTHCLINENLSGPMNLVAPHPVTNLDFTRTLAQVLRRPAFLPVPRIIARLAMGEMADPLLLFSAHVQPMGLLRSGYQFQHPRLEQALQDLLNRRQVDENPGSRSL
jgi:uncharacterized protein (TIGR01777 family)